MRLAAFILAMLVLLAPLVAAQGDGFAAFWKEFSAAAAKRDKDKIRTLTQYPSKELGKDFDAIWKEDFPRSMLACLAKAKPERDDKFGNYVAFCKETIYGFERTPQGWRFVSTHPND